MVFSTTIVSTAIRFRFLSVTTPEGPARIDGLDQKPFGTLFADALAPTGQG